MGILAYILVFAVVLALCMAGLGISMLIRKDGKFPETEVGSNKNMRKMGITCTKQEEMRKHKKWLRKKSPAAHADHDCSGCHGCSLPTAD